MSSVKVFCRLVPKTFTSERKFQIFCEESVFLPREMKKPIYIIWFRNKLYEDFGDKAFIVPEEKLFPIINKNTGLTDHRLIQAAVIRLLRLCRIDPDKYYEWTKRALKVFNDNNCEKNIRITLVNEDREVSLIDFLLDLLEKEGVKF